MWVNAPKGGRSRILSFLFISLAGLSPLSQTKLFTSKLWVVYQTRQSKQCKYLILIFMCLTFTCCPRCHCQIFISEKSLDKYSSLKNIPLWKIFPFKKYPPLKILTPENIHPWKYSPLKNIHQGKIFSFDSSTTLRFEDWGSMSTMSMATISSWPKFGFWPS